MLLENEVGLHCLSWKVGSIYSIFAPFLQMRSDDTNRGFLPSPESFKKLRRDRSGRCPLFKHPFYKYVEVDSAESTTHKEIRDKTASAECPLNIRYMKESCSEEHYSHRKDTPEARMLQLRNCSALSIPMAIKYV